MKKYSSGLLIALVVTVSFALSFLHVKTVSSATNHVVISEVMLSLGTGLSTKEFIEIYNPTETAVDLANWKVSKKNEAGDQEDFLISTMSGTIAGRGFFLIASEDYNSDATVSADLTYSTASASLTDDNTIILYDNNSAAVDKVGLGDALDSETAPETNPTAGKSRERKAVTDSTSDTMATGGIHEVLGNGEDSGNNANDFVLRNFPQPQNSESALEPAFVSVTPSPSATASTTPVESESPTPTASATPQSSETPSATPTPTLTATPTPTPSASPTIEPTATPTQSPTPSPTPSPSPTSSVTPSPTPTPTPSATPTSEPTTTPTQSPTASPSVTPTPSSSPTASESPTPTASATPTIEPTPTPSESPSSSPTVSPSPTQSPSESPAASITPKPHYHFSRFMCRMKFKSLSFGFFRLRMPILWCGFSL